jgi:hypothetical protein
MSFEVNTTTRGIRIRVEPELQAKGWVDVESADTEEEFIDNIVNAVEKAHEMGKDHGREFAAPKLAKRLAREQGLEEGFAAGYKKCLEDNKELFQRTLAADPEHTEPHSDADSDGEYSYSLRQQAFD